MMTSNFYIRDEIDFLIHSTTLCVEQKKGYNDYWQVAPLQCSIPYTPGCLDKLHNLKEKLRGSFPKLIDFGEKRASRAYIREHDTITKPSYIYRLKNFCGTNLNQFQILEDLVNKEPASGGLVFSVFSPQDLINRRRPGYVPCLISGSFLLHEGELHLNAFFRSQSVIEFGIFDLIFLRDLQKRFFEKIHKLPRREKSLLIGPLNLHFGRVIVRHNFAEGASGYIPRNSIVFDWIREVEMFSVECRL